MNSVKAAPETAAGMDREAKKEARESASARCALPEDWLMVPLTNSLELSILRRQTDSVLSPQSAWPLFIGFRQFAQMSKPEGIKWKSRHKCLGKEATVQLVPFSLGRLAVSLGAEAKIGGSKFFRKPSLSV